MFDADVTDARACWSAPHIVAVFDPDLGQHRAFGPFDGPAEACAFAADFADALAPDDRGR